MRLCREQILIGLQEGNFLANQLIDVEQFVECVCEI